MKTNITIQSTRDRQYLGAPGLWEAHREKAREFPNSMDAVKYCISAHLLDVQIVFSFENPAFDFTVPITTPRD